MGRHQQRINNRYNKRRDRSYSSSPQSKSPRRKYRDKRYEHNRQRSRDKDYNQKREIHNKDKTRRYQKRKRQNIKYLSLSVNRFNSESKSKSKSQQKNSKENQREQKVNRRFNQSKNKNKLPLPFSQKSTYFNNFVENRNSSQSEEESLFKGRNQSHKRNYYKNQNNQEEEEEEIVKEEICFEPSGILAEYTNTIKGVLLKFTEPLDAAVPKDVFWRIYPYKGEEKLEILYLSYQSCFLFGRDRTVVDFPLDNTSCSGQHAVIQFRQVAIEDEKFNQTLIVKPYIIDLESTNGTKLNGQKLDQAKYYELKHEDMLEFAFSTRKYLVMKSDQPPPPM